MSASLSYFKTNGVLRRGMNSKDRLPYRACLLREEVVATLEVAMVTGCYLVGGLRQAPHASPGTQSSRCHCHS